MAQRRAEIVFLADASSVVRAARQAERATKSAATHMGALGGTAGKLNTAFRALGRNAAYAGAAIGAGLVVEVKRSVDAFTGSEQVQAQTIAGLKSTGQQANVTAKSINALATAVSRKSGIDDKAVQITENMLLTFTKVRNEVGKGNRIFDQATRAVADMATKMNGGAVPSAEKMQKTAILVGKALNDPIRGLTALNRVGVQFAQRERDKIKALVESGRTMEAQKIILRELQTEFGGAAAAAGGTFGGSLAKLKTEVGNVEEAIGAGFVPVIGEVTRALTRESIKWQPTVQRAARDIGRVFDRGDLSLGQKIERAFKVAKIDLAPLGAEVKRGLANADIGGKFERLVEAAVPRIANAMAAAAPRAASAFVKGFQNAGTWGKLLTLAFIASKLGAFRGAGAFAATNFSKGFAAGSAKLSNVARTMMVTAAMSGGFSGRIAGRLFGGKAAAAAGTALKIAPWAAVGLIIAQQLGLDKVLRRQISDAVNSAADWVTGSSALGRIGASVGASITVPPVRPPMGMKRQGKSRAVIGRGAPSVLFPLDRQLAQLQAQRDTMQAGFDTADSARERARLVAAVAAARRGRLVQVARARGTSPGMSYRTSSGGQLAVITAGRMLQGMGLQVGESRYFGGVTTNRHKRYPNDHYSGNSIDVNSAGGGSAELGRLKAALATLRKRFGGSLQNGLIEDAGAANQHLHATFANSRVARVVRSVMAPASGGSGSAAPSGSRRVVDRGGVRDAVRALREFDHEAKRAKKLAQIDLKIKGLERVKAFKDAIAGIGSTLKDKLSSAIGEFQSKWEATVGRDIDKANAAALDAFDAGTAAEIANGPAAKKLAELQAEGEATAMAAEDAANQQALDDARRSGDPRQIEAANAAIRETARQREITKAAKAAEEERKGIEERRAKERTDLEEQQSKARQARLDADTAGFATALDQRLGAELAALETKKKNYAEFVQSIQQIFASAGLSPDAFGLGGVQYTPSPDEEAAVSAGSGVMAAPGGRRRQPAFGWGYGYGLGGRRRHRASGGLMDGYRTIYRTGELGPEDIYVNRAGNLAVRPASQTAGRGGGVTVNFNDKVTVGSRRELDVFANRLAYRVAHG